MTPKEALTHFVGHIAGGGPRASGKDGVAGWMPVTLFPDAAVPPGTRALLSQGSPGGTVGG